MSGDAAITSRTEAPAAEAAQKVLQSPLIESLRLVIRQPQNSSELFVIELHAPSTTKTHWLKKLGDFFKKVTGFFKEVLPIIISLATVGVGMLTYQFSVRQSALTQADLKTKALEDFIQDNEGKRTLAAIKLAQYGADALPVVRQSMGVADDNIRGGAVLTAEQMFKAPQSVSREKLLEHMLDSFKENNPTLNLGALEFYLSVAPLLTNQESSEFVSLLKRRMGADGSLCSREDDKFVTVAARYLGNKASDRAKEAPAAEQLGDFKTLLLGLARNCPWAEPSPDAVSRYEGARIQAVTALVTIAGRLPPGERDSVVKGLQELASHENATPQFKAAILGGGGALEQIEQTQRP